MSTVSAQDNKEKFKWKGLQVLRYTVKTMTTKTASTAENATATATATATSTTTAKTNDNLSEKQW